MSAQGNRVCVHFPPLVLLEEDLELQLPSLPSYSSVAKHISELPVSS